MAGRDQALAVFRNNPYTEYFLYLLSANAETSIELASDPTQDLTTERILKTIGSAQGAKLLNTLVQTELEYINEKVNQET